jgi:hypothetical protein
MSAEALQAGSLLATRLRLRKAVQIQALGAGIGRVVIPRDRLWSPEDAAALARWEALPTRAMTGDALRSRLQVWRRLDRQAQELHEEELELHVCEVWESSDECALAAWEHYLARQTGQVPLFAEVAYA